MLASADFIATPPHPAFKEREEVVHETLVA